MNSQKKNELFSFFLKNSPKIDLYFFFMRIFDKEENIW